MYNFPATTNQILFCIELKIKTKEIFGQKFHIFYLQCSQDLKNVWVSALTFPNIFTMNHISQILPPLYK